MKNIGIIGSGSWGIALAIHLSSLGNNVKVWSFDETETKELNIDKKCRFLPEVVIPDNITCYTDITKVVDDVEFVLHVTPSKFTRTTFKLYKDILGNTPVILCNKGFEADTLKTLEEVIKDELPSARVGVLSGPSHAEEVSKHIPTLLVVASKELEIQHLIQDTFMCDYMRIYRSYDVIGTELGGALKNIIAFCAGLATELNLGDNTFAALATRGLVEITRLGTELGGNKDTFYGLTGLGDLIVTCMSQHSRNRRAGKLIGKGYTIEETKKEVGMVIESIDNIDVAYNLAKINNIEMPIVEAVYNILHNNHNPKEELIKLMNREKKSE